MKQSLLCFLLLTSYFSLHAQGFLGRKLIVKYNFHTNLALFNPTYNKAVSIDAKGISSNNKTEKEASVGLNKIHEIGGEYIYSRTHSIGFFIGMTRTSLDYQYGQSSKFNSYDNYYYDDYYYNSSGFYIYNPYDLRIKLYSYNFEIKWTKYFNKGGVPLGLYRTWSLGYLRNSIYDRIELESETKSTKIHAFGATAIGFELGKQKIYYDRFVVNIAMSFRYIFGGRTFLSNVTYFLVEEDLVGEFYEPNTEQKRLKQEAKNRLVAQQSFNIKFGVGYLIK